MQNIAFEIRKYFSDNKLKLSLTDRYAFAGDAGFYYLLPQAIVQPDSLEDIQQLFLFSKTIYFLFWQACILNYFLN